MSSPQERGTAFCRKNNKKRSVYGGKLPFFIFRNSDTLRRLAIQNYHVLES